MQHRELHRGSSKQTKKLFRELDFLQPKKTLFEKKDGGQNAGPF